MVLCLYVRGTRRWGHVLVSSYRIVEPRIKLGTPWYKASDLPASLGRESRQKYANELHVPYHKLAISWYFKLLKLELFKDNSYVYGILFEIINGRADHNTLKTTRHLNQTQMD